jgi:periplasmic divalent cation tolerance protein
MSFIQISTTCDERGVIEKIANHLVENSLAACCQIEGPITSVYRWQGKVEMATEYRCLIKTTAARYSDVESAIRQLHSYDQPQITAVAISNIDGGYAEWVRQNTTV